MLRGLINFTAKGANVIDLVVPAFIIIVVRTPARIPPLGHSRTGWWCDGVAAQRSLQSAQARVMVDHIGARRLGVVDRDC